MTGAVPVVEVADHPYTASAGRPHGERGSGHRSVQAVVHMGVGAEHLPQLLVAALADQMQVDLAQGRQEAVGVLGGQRVAVVLDSRL